MSNLYIQQLPSSFSSLGEKHNALVDVVKSMSGAGGISVKVSDANVIIDGSGISVTGGGTEGAPIQVVGSDGLLNTVPKHSTWTTPTTYPTQLVAFNYPIQTSIDGFTGFQFTNSAVTAIVGASGYVYSDSSITAVLGTNGLSIEDNGTNQMLIDELGLTWRNGAVTAYIDSDGFTFTNGSATGTLGAGNLTLESTTLVATYAVNKVAFSNGTQEAIVSATGFEYEDASITAVLGANGLRIEDNGTNEITVDELGIAWTNASSAWGISSTGLRYSDPAVLARFGDAGVQWTDGTNSFAATTIGFLMVTSTGSVSIPFSAVSGAIQLREIDVCQNGVAKKMMILASQLY